MALTDPSKLNKAEQIPEDPPLTYLSNLGKKAGEGASQMASYATNTLKDVNSKTAEEKQRAQSQAAVASAVQQSNNDENDPETTAQQNDVNNARKLKKGFNLMEIFKIVPIGINVLAKGPNLASGAADLLVGLQKAVINSGVSIVDFIKSLFSFTLQGWIFAMIMLGCFIENIGQLNSCIIFYVIDIILFIMMLFLLSIMNLLDALFFENALGFSLVEYLMKIADMLYDLEEKIYKFTGFHVLQYPKCVQQMCYKCSIKSNKQKAKESTVDFVNAVTKRIPRRLMEPIHKFISAGKKFASVFKI